MGIQHEQIQEPSAHVTPLKSRPDGTLYVATLYGNTLLLQTVNGEENPSRWKLTQQSGQLKLEWTDTHSGMPDTAELLAALEAAFTRYPNQHQLNLVAPVGQADELLQSGVLLRSGNNHLIASVSFSGSRPESGSPHLSHTPFPHPTSSARAVATH